MFDLSKNQYKGELRLSKKILDQKMASQMSKHIAEEFLNEKFVFGAV